MADHPAEKTPLNVVPDVEDILPEPFPEVGRPRRGRKRKRPTKEQAAEFLRLLQQGYGRASTCSLTGTSYRTFIGHLREDAEFADAVRIAEAARIDACEALLYKLVIGRGEPAIRLRAAVAYMGRRDKLDIARNARRAKAGKPAK